MRIVRDPALPYQVVPANRHAISYAKLLLASCAGGVGHLVRGLHQAEALAIVPAEIGDAQIRRYSRGFEGSWNSAVEELWSFLADQAALDDDVVVQDLWARPAGDAFDVAETVRHEVDGATHYFQIPRHGSGPADLMAALAAKASTRAVGFTRRSGVALADLRCPPSILFVSAYEGNGFLLFR